MMTINTRVVLLGFTPRDCAQLFPAISVFMVRLLIIRNERPNTVAINGIGRELHVTVASDPMFHV